MEVAKIFLRLNDQRARSPERARRPAAEGSPVRA
jgi:hypothetical protein